MYSFQWWLDFTVIIQLGVIPTSFYSIGPCFIDGLILKPFFKSQIWVVPDIFSFKPINQSIKNTYGKNQAHLWHNNMWVFP